MSIASKLRAVTTLGMLLTAAQPLAAQTAAPQNKSWELRIINGQLLATGEQRNTIKNAKTTSAQLSWVVRPSVALTATFGWARSRDLGMIDTPKLDVFTSDIGIEARGGQWFSKHAVTLSPFIGAGAGVRSYNYHSLDVDATHNRAAYAAVGGEIAVRRVALRLEVRNYMTGFTPLNASGPSALRNDVAVMAGLRLRPRR